MSEVRCQVRGPGVLGMASLDLYNFDQGLWSLLGLRGGSVGGEISLPYPAFYFPGRNLRY